MTTEITMGGLVVSSFVIGLSGAVMPGPVLAVTIGHAARLGVRAGPLVVLGHAALELILLLALVAGLGPLLTRSLVAGLVSGVGAIILLWLAIAMLRSLPGLRLDLGNAASGGPAGPVRDGVLLSLANPYWSLWWATVGLSLATVAMQAGLGWWGLAAFYFGHIGSDLAWFTLVSLVVARGRRFLSNKAYRALVAVCALFLLAFAAYFGRFAWQKLGAALG